MKDTPYDADLVALQALFKANMDQRSKAARAIKRYTAEAIEDPTEATREALASEAGHCRWIEDRIMTLLTKIRERKELAAWLPVLEQYQRRRADALTKLERLGRKAPSKPQEAANDFYEGDHGE